MSNEHFWMLVGFVGQAFTRPADRQHRLRGDRWNHWPAQFDLVWQADTGTWLPLFAEGRIDVTVTPEPTTLLLFATSAAGLGLARWLRRGRQHAA